VGKEIDALKLFNVKAEEILKTGFVRYLNERKPFQISIKGEGSEVRIETILPDQDSIDAFVLRFRLFYQKKDRCSFAKLAEIYDKAKLSNELKNQFLQARKRIDQYVNSVFPYNIKGCTATTVKDFFDMVLYGGLAHADLKKQPEFYLLMNTPVVAEVVQMTFCSILEFMLRAVVYVAQINKRAIEELTGT
jgi:hypothetical protein